MSDNNLSVVSNMAGAKKISVTDGNLKYTFVIVNGRGREPDRAAVRNFELPFTAPNNGFRMVLPLYGFVWNWSAN